MQEAFEYAIELAEQKPENIDENFLEQPGPSMGCRDEDDDDVDDDDVEEVCNSLVLSFFLLTKGY